MARDTNGIITSEPFRVFEKDVSWMSPGLEYPRFIAFSSPIGLTKQLYPHHEGAAPPLQIRAALLPLHVSSSMDIIINVKFWPADVDRATPWPTDQGAGSEMVTVSQ